MRCRIIFGIEYTHSGRSGNILNSSARGSQALDDWGIEWTEKHLGGIKLYNTVQWLPEEICYRGTKRERPFQKERITHNQTAVVTHCCRNSDSLRTLAERPEKAPYIRPFSYPISRRRRIPTWQGSNWCRVDIVQNSLSPTGMRENNQFLESEELMDINLYYFDIGSRTMKFILPSFVIFGGSHRVLKLCVWMSFKKSLILPIG